MNTAQVFTQRQAGWIKIHFHSEYKLVRVKVKTCSWWGEAGDHAGQDRQAEQKAAKLRHSRQSGKNEWK